MSLVVVAKYAGKTAGEMPAVEDYHLLLTAALHLLADGGDSRTLIRRLFPSGVVGMKVNCLTHQNATPMALADALSKILIEEAGISENNLIVWDRTSRELQQAGYKLNASSFGRRQMGTDANGVGYADDFETSGKANSRLSRILTEMVGHNVNLAVLKDHSIAGMSAGLKNMYGALHNPNKYHGDNCNPFAADINNLPTIRARHRLTIIDAVRVQYDNGPGFDPESFCRYDGLIISQDPVAADRVALDILDHCRVQNNLPALADTGRPVKYLDTAESIGLGTADMKQIEVRVVSIDRSGNASSGSLF